MNSLIFLDSSSNYICFFFDCVKVSCFFTTFWFDMVYPRFLDVWGLFSTTILLVDYIVWAFLGLINLFLFYLSGISLQFFVIFTTSIGCEDKSTVDICGGSPIVLSESNLLSYLTLWCTFLILVLVFSWTSMISRLSSALVARLFLANCAPVCGKRCLVGVVEL